MNKIYLNFYSEAIDTWGVTSEIAKSRGKCGRSESNDVERGSEKFLGVPPLAVSVAAFFIPCASA